MKRVTLSFDNGPTPGITDRVLDALAVFGVKASFFVVGSKLMTPAGRALAERAHSEGHWIGNHTLSHGAPLGEQSDPQVPEREIGQMDALLGPLAHDDRLFRPNGRGKLGPHVLSPAALDFIRQHRSTLVLWTHVPRDRVPKADAWIQDAQLASTESDWPLLVLHDRPSGHDVPGASMSHLHRYLGWALERGIQFTQEFPESCVPIRRGVIRLPIEPFVNHASVPAAATAVPGDAGNRPNY